MFESKRPDCRPLPEELLGQTHGAKWNGGEAGTEGKDTQVHEKAVLNTPSNTGISDSHWTELCQGLSSPSLSCSEDSGPNIPKYE